MIRVNVKQGWLEGVRLEDCAAFWGVPAPNRRGSFHGGAARQRSWADLSRRMLDYWTNFMKTGDPNGPGLPRWEPCAGEKNI